jgi:hypothetical protein
VKKTLCAAAAAFAISAVFAAPTFAAGNSYTFTFKANGKAVTAMSNKNMGGDKKGSASGKLVVNTGNNTVCYTLMTKGLTGIQEAHLHVGKLGQDGNDVVTFNVKNIGQTKPTCVKVKDVKLITDLSKNPENYYVNVHTSMYPDGAVRGQLAGQGAM